MSTLGRFLQAKEPLFDHALHQLEVRTHNKGVDVKLSAQIAEAVAHRTKLLGLTPESTGPELYLALKDKVAQHDAVLANAIGGSDPSDLLQMIPLVLEAAEKAPLPREGWFLKEDRAKDLLRRLPPLTIMDRLGHHLVSRLLESEDIYELLLALRFAESPEFLLDFNRLYHDLKASDFESRRIKVVSFDAAKWGDIAEPAIRRQHHNLTHSKEMGVIGVMPTTQARMTGAALTMLPLIFHYFNEIRLYSSFFKLMKAKKNFGAIVSETIIADPAHVKIADNAHIHWRVIQRYFGKLTTEIHPEIFEPHVQPEDLHWRRAEEVLFDIVPELGFWKELDYAAVSKGPAHDTVTFNLIDNTLCYANDIPYEDRLLYHFREALWNEVFSRYLGEATLQLEILDKLHNEVIKPEMLTRHV